MMPLSLSPQLALMYLRTTRTDEKIQRRTKKSELDCLRRTRGQKKASLMMNCVSSNGEI